MLTCKLGDSIINCYDGAHSKETLKSWANKNILVCSACGKPYEYCHGRIVHPYFRHKEKDQCEDKYSEAETEEHIEGKKSLYEWIKAQEGVCDAVLEAWLPETHQRPDIMFKYNGEKYVIEYQCTPIASQYLERHELYSAAGIHDIWILGTEKYLDKSEHASKNTHKTIEDYCSLYFDAILGVIVSNDLLNIDCVGYRIEPSSCYYQKESRNSIQSKRVTFDGCYDKYFIRIDSVCFSNGKIAITRLTEIEIKQYSDPIVRAEERKVEISRACNDYINTIFKYFEDKYDIDFYRMDRDFGFKSNLHYYEIGKTVNYPMVPLNKITYSKYGNVSSEILYFNVTSENTDDVIGYLECELGDEIERKLRLQEMRKEEKKRHQADIEMIKQRLQPYNSKKIYLLFLSDNNKLPASIRFKLVQNYYDDLLKTGEIILKTFQFLESKKADKFVLMIPRKRLCDNHGYRSFYKYYKDDNSKMDVLNDFISLGLTAFTYEDLMRDSI